MKTTKNDFVISDVVTNLHYTSFEKAFQKAGRAFEDVKTVIVAAKSISFVFNDQQKIKVPGNGGVAFSVWVQHCEVNAQEAKPKGLDLVA